MNNGEIFARRLRVLRAERKITLKQVSAKTGIHKNTLSCYERYGKFPCCYNLITLADYFGVTTDYLLGRTDNA